MRKLILITAFAMLALYAKAQELKATISVVSNQVGNAVNAKKPCITTK